MITSSNIYTITDMRKRANELLKLVARSKQPIGIFKNNKLQAYLVDPETLESLEALVEDYLDLKMVTNRLQDTQSFRDFKTFWAENKLST